MSPLPYVGLAAYERAVELADELTARVARWPAVERKRLGDQVLRAAESVAANIAEGSGRSSAADQRRLFLIARGSLYETDHWMRRAAKRGLIEHELMAMTEQVARPLNGLIRRHTR